MVTRLGPAKIGANDGAAIWQAWEMHRASCKRCGQQPDNDMAVICVQQDHKTELPC
jgi:hypothetical protein